MNVPRHFDQRHLEALTQSAKRPANCRRRRQKCAHELVGAELRPVHRPVRGAAVAEMLGAGRHQAEGPAAAAVVAEIEPPLPVGEDPGRGIEDRMAELVQHRAASEIATLADLLAIDVNKRMAWHREVVLAGAERRRPGLVLDLPLQIPTDGDVDAVHGEPRDALGDLLVVGPGVVVTIAELAAQSRRHPRDVGPAHIARFRRRPRMAVGNPGCGHGLTLPCRAGDRAAPRSSCVGAGPAAGRRAAAKASSASRSNALQTF